MVSVLEKLNKLMKKHVTNGSDIPFIAVPSTAIIMYIWLLLGPLWGFFTRDDNDVMKECFTITECLTYPLNDYDGPFNFWLSIIVVITSVVGCGWLISYPSDKAKYSEEFSSKTWLGMPLVMIANLLVIILCLIFLDSFSTYFSFEITRLTTLKGVGICTSLLTIAIVVLALAVSDNIIEAAATAWLMLTVLGAIVAIISYSIWF